MKSEEKKEDKPATAELEEFGRNMSLTACQVIAAGSMVNGWIAVPLMWFLVACCTTYGFLLNSEDDDGNPTTAERLHEIMRMPDTKERHDVSKKLIENGRKKHWLAACCWLLGAAAITKMLAAFLATRGIVVDTWL